MTPIVDMDTQPVFNNTQPPGPLLDVKVHNFNIHCLVS
jgi:hypothetical protein